MKKKVVILLILIALIVLVGYSFYIFRLEKYMSEQDTVIFGQNKLFPGSVASLRIVTLNHKNQEPIPDAEIKLVAQSKETKEKVPLYSGKTDELGTASVSFSVPELAEGDYDLIISTKSKLGKDSFFKPIKIEKDYKILLTTDKPIYQPGQTIHIRALAFSALTSKPAGNEEVTIEVEDSKGNKVFKKKIKTSEYGVVGADFILANELNLGLHTIRAKLGDYSSEKKVDVKRYVLPKFKIDFSTDKTYYLPSQPLSGVVSANYFFGKHVSNANVNVKVYTYEITMEQIADIKGKADEYGNFDFEYDLPSSFIGVPLEKGSSLVFFNISVIDQAGHEEAITKSVPIAKDPIEIELIPESGNLASGIENIVYVITTYPDGKPAETTLTLKDRKFKTNELGITEVKIIPEEYSAGITIFAEDAQGNKGSKTETFTTDYQTENILLRTDKSIYNVGDSVKLDIFYNRDKGTVYVDVIKNKQTILTKAIDIKEKRASLYLDLDEAMAGSVEIHAYKILRSSDITRDSKTIFVNPRKDIELDINLNKDSYLPGEDATIKFSTKKSGKPVPAAVGVNIVDESVFALQEKEAGFEKLYFALEKELLEPRYMIYGITVPTIICEKPILEPMVKTQAENILFAQAPSVDRFNLKTSSIVEKEQEIKLKKQRYFGGLGKFIYWLIILIPILIAGLTVYSYRDRKKTLLKEFGLSIPILSVGALVFNAMVAILVGLVFLIASLSGFRFDGLIFFIILIPLLVTPLVISLVFLIRHTKRANELFFWNSVLYSMYLVFVILFFVSFVIGNVDFESFLTKRLLWPGITLILIPLSFMVYSLDAIKNKQKIAIASIFLALFLFMPLGVGGGILVLSFGTGFTRQMQLGAAEQMSVEDVRFLPEMVKEEVVSPAEGKEKPRVRQFFPETLYSNPQIITDEEGKASVGLKVADSITTWRITALASSLNGDIGSSTKGMLVFQDFFIDIDLPVSLTQNDEVSIPIAVYNYLPSSQDVKLELVQEPWFELLDEKEKTMTIGSNDVKVVYYRIKVKQIGVKKLTVYAYGNKMSDAISRTIEIIPDGLEIRGSESDKLEKSIEKVITIPAEAIQNSESLFVKIYPGIFSQLVEGLDSMFNMPFGCFEQTSGITYPNVLVLDYMKATEQITPEIQLKAEHYIGVGYQRLMSFETSTPGGFDWYGRSPPKLLLTSFGLQEFTDMSKVYEVDDSLVPRTQKWLKSQQNPDGSWEAVDSLHFTHRLTGSKLIATCHVAWSLLYSGEKDIGKAVNYIRENIDYSENTDTYTLGVCANAMAIYNKDDSTTRDILNELDRRKTEANNTIFWTSPENLRGYDMQTVMGASGEMKDLETTALVAIAYIAADYKPQDVNKILNHLVQEKDTFGNWGSTHATILSLKALINSIGKTREEADATIKIYADDIEIASLRITNENNDVLQLVDLKEHIKKGDNNVKITISGKGNLFYQIVSSYYLPWAEEKVRKVIEKEKLISIDLDYDKTQLHTGDVVRADVKANFNGIGFANFVVIDLGIPPGFSVITADFDKIKNEGVIEKYDLTGRQIIIYVENLDNKGISFSYKLKPRYPIKAKTPKSKVYDYYNPKVEDEVEPIEMNVV